jgi:phosphoribosylformylglycinamidine cyclo-ligase
LNTSDSSREPLNYRNSGVDIDAGNALVERIKPLIRQTARQGVLGGIGGFGGLFEIPLGRYREPVLVSGTDGVGTKLKLASMMNFHSTIGIDLVAMCVNDIVVSGAEPLYFLDYFATGQLDLDQAESVIKGIADGCQLAGCALNGGETAEMPGMYAQGEYDLAGFAVGIVEKDAILSTDDAHPGQILLGLASSGPHSNGYSLIRKVLERSGKPLDTPFESSTLGLTLLTPTRIYVKSILKLLSTVPVSSIAHITGGGVLENLPRVLPIDTNAEIDLSTWDLPPVFQWLQQHGSLEKIEMLRTFNCGIGMVVAIDKKYIEEATNILQTSGEVVHTIGELVPGQGAPAVIFKGL